MNIHELLLDADFLLNKAKLALTNHQPQRIEDVREALLHTQTANAKLQTAEQLMAGVPEPKRG